MYIPDLNSYFIHIPKCGGTSVELFFWEMHGIKLPDKKIHPGPENAHRFQWGWRVPGLGYETQHISAYHAKIREIPEFLNADYKFAFVRNPWDRFISEILWKRETFGPKHNEHSQIRRMIMDKGYSEGGVHFRAPHDAPMWKFVYDDNMELLVDDVFKLEEIDKAEKKLSEVFNREIKFGHYNKAKLADKPYKEYYTDRIVERLYPLIQKDLEVFGYE